MISLVGWSGLVLRSLVFTDVTSFDFDLMVDYLLYVRDLTALHLTNPSIIL
jgi:hypothetical protein